MKLTFLKHNQSRLICGTNITSKCEPCVTFRYLEDICFIMRMCDNIYINIFDDNEIRIFIFL